MWLCLGGLLEGFTQPFGKARFTASCRVFVKRRTFGGAVDKADRNALELGGSFAVTGFGGSGGFFAERADGAFGGAVLGAGFLGLAVILHCRWVSCHDAP